MNKKILRWIIPVFFLVITAVFFYKAFLGYNLQGTDSTLALMKKASAQAQAGPIASYWMDDFWAGLNSPLFAVNLFTLVMKIVPYDAVQTVLYFLTILLSLLFTYFFLRKIKLSPFSAAFGAVAYAFTPHFITLSTAAHLTVIEMMMFPPLLFHLLTVLFDQDERDEFKKMVCLALAGIAWGIMMTDDVQRGLYVSIAAAVYIAFSVFRKNGVKPSNFLKKFTDKGFLIDIARILLVLVVLFLSFFNGLKSQLSTLQFRNAQSQTASAAPQQTGEIKWKNSTDWSYHPFELIDSFAFGYHGNMSGDSKAPYWGSFLYAGSSESLGFFVILFSLIGVFAYYRKNFLVKFFFWTGLAALILSFGRFLPGAPFYWLFYQLPLMGNFRVPAKFIAVTAFAASILAAFGFEFLYEQFREETEKHNKLLSNIIKIIGVFLGIIVIWTLYCLVAWNDLSFDIGQKIGNADMGRTAVSNIALALVRVMVFAGLTMGVFIAFMKFRKKTWVLPATAATFTLLLIIDLWSIDWFYLDKAYFQPRDFYREDGTVQFLKNEYRTEIFRVATSLLVPANGQVQPYPVTGLKGYYQTYMFPYFGIQPMDIPAFSGVIPEYNLFFSKMMERPGITRIQNINDLIDFNIGILRTANVKYVLLDSAADNTNLLLTNMVWGYDNRQHYVYYVKDYLPRVGFFADVISVNDNNEALLYLNSRMFAHNKTLVVNAKVTATNAPALVVPQQIMKYKPWNVTVSANAPVDGWVLFNAKYDRDWSAYIDGKKTRISPADYLLMAVPVTRGSHSVEFRFEPDSVPFLVSLLTIIAGLAGAVVYGLMKLQKKNGEGKKPAA